MFVNIIPYAIVIFISPFYLQHIEVALENSIIRGELDRSETGIIYTESYVKRYGLNYYLPTFHMYHMYT